MTVATKTPWKQALPVPPTSCTRYWGDQLPPSEEEDTENKDSDDSDDSDLPEKGDIIACVLPGSTLQHPLCGSGKSL